MRNAAFIIHVEISEGKDRGETGVLKSSPTGLQRGPEDESTEKRRNKSYFKNTERQRITRLKKHSRSEKQSMKNMFKRVLFNLNF